MDQNNYITMHKLCDLGSLTSQQYFSKKEKKMQLINENTSYERK